MSCAPCRYDTSPPRDLATGALLLSSAGSLMYALARNSTMVVVSRFLVGAAAGVQAPLMSMAAAMVGRGAASSTITGLRSMHIVAWILGTGSAAIATFVHTPAPGMMGHMDHQIPHYMRMMHRMSANTSYGYADSIGAISGPPLRLFPSWTLSRRARLARTSSVAPLTAPIHLHCSRPHHQPGRRRSARAAAGSAFRLASGSIRSRCGTARGARLSAGRRGGAARGPRSGAAAHGRQEGCCYAGRACVSCGRRGCKEPDVGKGRGCATRGAAARRGGSRCSAAARAWRG